MVDYVWMETYSYGSGISDVEGRASRENFRRWLKSLFLLGAGFFLLLALYSFNPCDPTFSFTQSGWPVLNNPSNFGGRFGSYFAGISRFFLGESSYIFVLLLLMLGWSFIWREGNNVWMRLTGVAGIQLVLSTLLVFLRGDTPDSSGGLLGLVASDLLRTYFGAKGGYLILGVLGLGFIAIAHRLFVAPLLELIQICRPVPAPETPALAEAERTESRKHPVKPRPPKEEEPRRPRRTVPAPEPVAAAEPEEPPATPGRRKSGSFELPPISLLTVSRPVERETPEDLKSYAQVIEETLADFGIEGEIVDSSQGPRITLFELQLAPGIPIQRIHRLSDNIAMSLKATSIRIVAPLPGKSTVGIEVPNREISIVSLREIVESKEFQASRSRLTLAIGKDIMGRSIIADLKAMPHLLIAGATGSGKTVCLNSLITSIVLKARPDEVKFLMIDPKRVEMTLYNDLPHLLLPVVVETKQAIIALKWLIAEMERRYRVFADARARNIEAYNQNPKREPLPYVIVVVDEIADLMIIARTEIESSIIRLAQLARAAGIHLILATQRPSVNVITGVIKANFPCRIAFQVPSRYDSRTVIDTVGAEKLLGRGDLLFIPPATARSIRIQGSYVSDKEIEDVCAFLKKQRGPDYRMEILEVPEAESGGETGPAEEEDTAIYSQAKRIVLETRIASISMIQRRLQIGFNRAARMIERMEHDGLVGPYREGKPREVIGMIGNDE